MKLLGLCLITILTTQIAASQYIPFPESNAKWSMSVDVYDNPDSNPYIDSEEGYVHEINGDTIVNGFNYQKVFERPTWWKRTIYNQLPDGDYIITNEAGNYASNTSTLIGLMRQDLVTRKVYFINLAYSPCTEPNGPFPLGEEILLFDFDLTIGDTIYLGPEPESHIIESIDSIQYNDGIYRKRYFPVESYPEFYFIEGIGASTGLFAGVRGLFVEGEICSLNCFSEAEEYIIGNSPYNCDSIDVVIPVVEVDLETKVSIYPNPFYKYLQIDLEYIRTKNFQVHIYNALGQLVLKQVITSNQQHHLDIQNLTNGIYLITINNGTEILTTQKIIKNP